MTRNDYWAECLSIAADECGATLTAEQIAYMAKAVEDGRDTMSMAFHVPESPLPGEIKRLKAELVTERSKVVCPDCGGSGRLQFTAGPWGINQHCSRCNSDGKIVP